MKKYILLLAILIASASFGCNSMNGQSSTYLNLGLNLPQGDFGSLAQNCVLYTNSCQGGAKTGVNVGFKFVSNTKATGLGFMIAVDGFYNDLQNNLSSENFVPYYVPEIEGIEINVRNPRYLNIPLMFGLNYSLDFNRYIGVFVEGAAGINARFIIPCKITAFDYTMDLKPDYTFTNTYATKFSFAYQFGGGIKIKNAVTLGVSYFDLGHALVYGESEKLLKTTDFTPVIGEREDFKYRQLSTKILVVRLGINLR